MRNELCHLRHRDEYISGGSSTDRHTCRMGDSRLHRGHRLIQFSSTIHTPSPTSGKHLSDNEQADSLALHTGYRAFVQECCRHYRRKYCCCRFEMMHAFVSFDARRCSAWNMLLLHPSCVQCVRQMCDRDRCMEDNIEDKMPLSVHLQATNWTRDI